MATNNSITSINNILSKSTQLSNIEPIIASGKITTSSNIIDNISFPLPIKPTIQSGPFKFPAYMSPKTPVATSLQPINNARQYPVIPPNTAICQSKYIDKFDALKIDWLSLNNSVNEKLNYTKNKVTLLENQINDLIAKHQDEQTYLKNKCNRLELACVKLIDEVQQLQNDKVDKIKLDDIDDEEVEKIVKPKKRKFDKITPSNDTITSSSTSTRISNRLSKCQKESIITNEGDVKFYNERCYPNVMAKDSKFYTTITYRTNYKIKNITRITATYSISRTNRLLLISVKNNGFKINCIGTYQIEFEKTIERRTTK